MPQAETPAENPDRRGSAGPGHARHKRVNCRNQPPQLQPLPDFERSPNNLRGRRFIPRSQPAIHGRRCSAHTRWSRSRRIGSTRSPHTSIASLVRWSDLCSPVTRAYTTATGYFNARRRGEHHPALAAGRIACRVAGNAVIAVFIQQSMTPAHALPGASRTTGLLEHGPASRHTLFLSVPACVAEGIPDGAGQNRADNN
ncbi:MAG: hypothetical protein KatS3mg132_457 [Limisphaera sp.]|nr:MAG: hypothetical protein KatS3mg132_457 [Limisphaera sp.]